MMDRTQNSGALMRSDHPGGSAPDAVVARILDVAASGLDDVSTLTHPAGYVIPQCMTAGFRDVIVGRAADSVIDSLYGLPARLTARAAFREIGLPPVDGTVGEYAALLRGMAVAL